MIKTEWKGLWKKKDALYGSVPIKKSQLLGLPDDIRILIRYNKYYESGSKRPKFVYSFVDTDGQESVLLEEQADVFTEIEKIDNAYPEGFIPVEVAAKIIANLLSEKENASIEQLSERAHSLLRKNRINLRKIFRRFRLS